MASRTCYSALDLDGLRDKAETADNAAYIRRVLASGHTLGRGARLLHLRIEGVSRTLLAQITRHRLASFSVQSQRYVSVAGQEVFDYVCPRRIRGLGPEAQENYLAQMKTHCSAGTTSGPRPWARTRPRTRASCCRARRPPRMTVTMNARGAPALLLPAHVQPRAVGDPELAWQMYALVAPLAPAVFADAGPGCVRGACPEGKRSCGRADEVRARKAACPGEEGEGMTERSSNFRPRREAPRETPENLIVGRNAVREALRAGRDMEKLLVSRGEATGSLREILALAREKGVVVQEVDRRRLDEMAENHQGVAALASMYAYSTLRRSWPSRGKRASRPSSWCWTASRTRTTWAPSCARPSAWARMASSSRSGGPWG